MTFFASDDSATVGGTGPRTHALIHGQTLSANRDRLDPESISRSGTNLSDPDDDDICGSSEDEIHSAGYGRKCISPPPRCKSIIDDGLYRLGFKRLTPSQMQKLHWEVIDLKIHSWLCTARVAVETLFSGERILCDSVTSFSNVNVNLELITNILVLGGP